MNTLLSPTHQFRRAPAEPVALTPKTPAAPKRILLVDDDEATCRLCALVLSHAGYAVETAADGLLGWEAVCGAHHDLLITDLEMPCLNGVELVTRVRLAGMRLPIVILSGSVDQLELHDLARLELARVLQKPITIAELTRTVEDVLLPTPEAGLDTAHSAPSPLAMARIHRGPVPWGLNE